MVLGSRGCVGSSSLAGLFDRGHRVVQPVRNGSERRLGFRQPLLEILAFGTLLTDGRFVYITEPGLLVEERRVRHQAIESEKNRPERRLGRDDVITSPRLERRDRER